MELGDVLELLSDGHSVYSLEAVGKLCEVVGVPFPEHLVFGWESRQDAMNRYGFVAVRDCPSSGVNSLDLSYYVADALGLGAPGRGYTGRGFQAQANGRAIAQRFQAS